VGEIWPLFTRIPLSDLYSVERETGRCLLRYKRHVQTRVYMLSETSGGLLPLRTLKFSSFVWLLVLPWAGVCYQPTVCSCNNPIYTTKMSGSWTNCSFEPVLLVNLLNQCLMVYMKRCVDVLDTDVSHHYWVL